MPLPTGQSHLPTPVLKAAEMFQTNSCLLNVLFQSSLEQELLKYELVPVSSGEHSKMARFPEVDRGRGSGIRM